MSETLLHDIAEYCRRARMAESTFGRLAVNDGKLVSRLRLGGRVTTDTVARVHSFIARPPAPAHAMPPPPAMPAALAAPALRDARQATLPEPTAAASMAGTGRADAPATAMTTDAAGGERNFRFYDNRQKYLLFVTTCSEKWVIAQRVGMELANLHPRPPALRVFDAGMGDGTVLARTMRAMHHRFPTMPFYIVGKEISLEDVRLVLEKMPDRLYEHPATVLVMTNLYYAEAPWLKPNSVTAATSLVWQEIVLTGSTAHDFEAQMTEANAFLSEHWRARTGRSGNPVYEKPVVLVIYREDHRFLLDQVRPRRGFTEANYDLVIASQPYRARAAVAFKAEKVVAPLARALAPGGRLIAIHSHGNDPGLDIIRRIWPGEAPFTTDRHALLRATKAALGSAGRDLNFGAYADARSLFRYDMHTLPNEISATIGTSTLFAAWNAAVYVAQIEDQRLSEAIASGAWLEATRAVLQQHGALWFWDESFVISRKRNFG
jgi:SAM-dependent methyltransferase